MNVIDAIQNRRSIKRFTARQLTRAEIEGLLAAVLAPNHRLTQPWRFYVLGPEARYGYGFALGARKAKKIEDPAAAQKLKETIGEEHRALPLMLVVAVADNAETPEIREEDYAATMMAIQNVMLAAVDAGFGTSIKSGAVMSDPAARAAAGVKDGERIVAVINIGEPAEVPPPKARSEAPSVTTWMP